jgi:type IV pilus assembly protein PilA
VSDSHQTVRKRPSRQGLALTSLILGVISIPTFGLFVIGAVLALIFGIIALVKANRAPDAYGGKGFAVAGIVTSGISLVILPFYLGIVAAIAIPSLLRARVSANESATLGDIRTVIMAEAAYQSANKGFYDSPACLADPARCIPDYRGPTFLDPALAALPAKSGYERTFHPQPPPGDLPPGASRSGLVSFAIVAVPVAVDKTGVRGFCGDSSGRICATNDGSAPPVVDGVCGACIDLK